MEYHYRLTQLAITDIDETLDYISETIMNPGASHNLFHSIMTEIKRICGNPYAPPDCSYYLIDNPVIRHSIIGNYVLFFEIKESEKAITILRFLYGGMNISNMTTIVNQN